jgi:hypothetical protein
VLPGRDDEDAPAIVLVAEAPDEATPFERVERRGRRRGTQAGDLGSASRRTG